MLKTFALGLLGLAAASGASAQTYTDIPARQGNSTYLQDGRGTIVRSPFGLCWRTGTWTPADAVPGCDGELVPPVAKPIAPEPPAAAPVVQSPPPKRCDFSVTLGADEAFPFNKATLSPVARKRIDEEVATKLSACAKIDVVLITGHSDRLGSQQYNQRLSEKRADAVASYLKDKGIDAPMDTLGVGKTQSIKACDDKLPRARLIECLAPNRRVTIEVRGVGR